MWSGRKRFSLTRLVARILLEEQELASTSIASSEISMPCPRALLGLAPHRRILDLDPMSQSARAIERAEPWARGRPVALDIIVI
jgi:hypothetical protein